MAEEKDRVEGELRVLDWILYAHKEFCSLPSQHPNEMADWVDGVHRLQDLIAMRVAREYRPDIFPKKG